MPAKKSESRAADQFGIRIGENERAYLRRAAERLSEQSPAKIGLGPFLIWAAKREAEKLLGQSFTEYEAAAQGKAKGEAVRDELREGLREASGSKKRGKGGGR